MKILIFKDKFNAKPPGGEGFLHITMVFSFINSSNQWMDGMEIFLLMYYCNRCKKKMVQLN